MQLIQHFGKQSPNTKSPTCHLCGLYFSIWQKQIMITASPGFTSPASPFCSCSCPHSGFMIIFSSFSFPISHPPPSSSLYVSLSVSDHFIFFPFSVSVLPLFCSIRTTSNKVYIAKVKEKHQAKKIYEQAHRQGDSCLCRHQIKLPPIWSMTNSYYLCDQGLTHVLSMSQSLLL